MPKLQTTDKENGDKADWGLGLVVMSPGGSKRLPKSKWKQMEVDVGLLPSPRGDSSLPGGTGTGMKGRAGPGYDGQNQNNQAFSSNSSSSHYSYNNQQQQQQDRRGQPPRRDEDEYRGGKPPQC
jgi:hypothetical protein